MSKTLEMMASSLKDIHKEYEDVDCPQAKKLADSIGSLIYLVQKGRVDVAHSVLKHYHDKFVDQYKDYE